MQHEHVFLVLQHKHEVKKWRLFKESFARQTSFIKKIYFTVTSSCYGSIFCTLAIFTFFNLSIIFIK